jgi:hypothetical protein
MRQKLIAEEEQRKEAVRLQVKYAVFFCFFCFVCLFVFILYCLCCCLFVLYCIDSLLFCLFVGVGARTTETRNDATVGGTTEKTRFEFEFVFAVLWRKNI